jgi:hypothetical protein
MKRMGKILLALVALMILGQAASASATPWCGPAKTVVKTTTAVRNPEYPYCAPAAVYYPSVSVVPVTTMAAYVAPVTYVYPVVVPAPVVVPRVTYVAPAYVPAYYPPAYCY